MYFADASRELTDHVSVAAERLDDHLIQDHGRLAYEITGLPLPDLHELEHFEATMGLLDLHHRHRG